MNVYQMYFSPTGGTKKVADLIGSAWNCQKTNIDLTDQADEFSGYEFQEEDVCIAAVPAFGGRVPETALVRIRKMSGQNARMILVAVYGNRAFEDTLLELQDTAKTAGFRCIAAIAAVAQHSIMPQFGAGRPDEQDEEELRTFAEKIKRGIETKTAMNEVKVPGALPYKVYKGVPFKPKAGKACLKCGVCAAMCPVNAIPKDNPAAVEEAVCISCMRCVAICPQHARGVNKALLFAASQKMKKACSQRKENELMM